MSWRTALANLDALSRDLLSVLFLTFFDFLPAILQILTALAGGLRGFSSEDFLLLPTATRAQAKKPTIFQHEN